MSRNIFLSRHNDIHKKPSRRGVLYRRICVSHAPISQKTPFRQAGHAIRECGKAPSESPYGVFRGTERCFLRVVKDAFPRPKRLFRIVSYGKFDAHLWSVCRNRMILYVLRLHTKRHAVCMPSPWRSQGRESWRHTKKHSVSRMPHPHYIMTVMENAAIHMLANQSRDAKSCVSRASMRC